MAFAAVLLLTGCGHNAIQYGDGIGFDVGINPNNYMLSLNLRYGKILSAVVRDNVELELSGKADANGMSGDKNTTGASSDGNLKLKIGRQINGATVDLVNAGKNTPISLPKLKNTGIIRQAAKTENLIAFSTLFFNVAYFAE